jgi:hypothetical protein
MSEKLTVHESSGVARDSRQKGKPQGSTTAG